MHFAVIGATFALLYFAYRVYKTIVSTKDGDNLKASSTNIRTGKVPPGPSRMWPACLRFAVVLNEY